MTAGISFEVEHSGNSSLRRGSIEFASRQKRIETPACMTYTLRGAVPHLVADNLSSLPTDLVQISLEHFLEQQEPSSFKYPFGIHQYLHLQDSVIFCDVRDPRQIPSVSFNTNAYVSVESHSGVRQITPEFWKKAMTCYRPDVVAPIGDMITDTTVSNKRIARSVNRSIRWLDELLIAAKELDIALFAPVMGHTNIEERVRSAELTSIRDVQGFIINVLGLENAYSYVKASTDHLPENKPRIAYGLSHPEDILEGVSHGIDLFDGSYAYKVTEKGHAMTAKFGLDLSATLKGGSQRNKTINLWDPAVAHDFEAIDATCSCHACSRPHSKAYIHHLLNAHEMLGPILLMSHNIYQLDQFMGSIRQSIEQNRFEKDKADFTATFHNEEESDIHKDVLDTSIGAQAKKKRAVFV